MDLSAWISVIALILVVPLGVATNLLTPRVISYLEKRKLIKTHRTKEQELAAYRRVEAFKNGSRDKYPYYILLAASSVACAVASETCIILAALNYAIFVEPFINILWVLAVAFGGLSIVLMIAIAVNERRIEQFPAYQAEIRKKWGDGVI